VPVERIPLAILYGRGLVRLLLIGRREEGEVLARHVDDHGALDLLLARILLDRLDEGVHGHEGARRCERAQGAGVRRAPSSTVEDGADADVTPCGKVRPVLYPEGARRTTARASGPHRG